MDTVGVVIKAAYEARRTLGKALHPTPPPPNALAQKLEEDGVVVIERLFPAAFVDELVRKNRPYFEFERLEDLIYSPDAVKVQEAVDIEATALRKFYGLHIKRYDRKFDVNREVIPLIDPIMRAYYRSPYFVRNVYCYRTQPVPEALGSYRWHRDNYPPGSARAILYLTDVESVEDGPTAVALGSHRGFEPELGKVGDRYPEEYANSYEVKTCLGKKGTLILFNNNTIHRAVDPRRGHRDVINFIMFPRLFEGPLPPPSGVDLAMENTFLKKYTR